MSRHKHHHSGRRNNETSSSHGRSNPNWDEQQRSREDWSQRRSYNDHRYNDMGYGSQYGSRYEDNNRSGNYYDTYDNNRDRGYNNAGSGLQGYRTDGFSRSDSYDRPYGRRSSRMNPDYENRRYSGFSDNSLFEDEFSGNNPYYNNSYSDNYRNERSRGYQGRNEDQRNWNRSSQHNRNEYESRTNNRNYARNHNDERSNDDRNFFERTGDKIKRGFNDMRERMRDRDHERHGYRSMNSYRNNESDYDNDYNRYDYDHDNERYSPLIYGSEERSGRFPEDRSNRTRQNFAEYDLDRHEKNNRRRTQQEEDAW